MKKEERIVKKKSYWPIVVAVQTICMVGVLIWSITQKVEAEKQKLFANIAKHDAEEQKALAKRTQDLALKTKQEAEEQKLKALVNKEEAEKYKALYEEVLKKKR